MITATRPKVEIDGRYTVTQSCAALGIYRTTLKKYTEERLIKVGFRKSGRKFYLGKWIIDFWEAQML